MAYITSDVLILLLIWQLATKITLNIVNIAFHSLAHLEELLVVFESVDDWEILLLENIDSPTSEGDVESVPKVAIFFNLGLKPCGK